MKPFSSRLNACAGLGVARKFAPVVPFALALAGLVIPDGFGAVEAKTPGSTYCFYGKCHRVKSIAETQALVGTEETLAASFYDDCANDSLNPCGLTSSGEVYRPNAADNAASPIYPDGTILLVWSPESREAAVIRVNNAGPYWGNRTLDVSKGVAQRLGFTGEGVATLKIRVIDAPAPGEATYRERRTYDRVPGYIGQYDSLDAAHAGMAAVMGLEAIAASVMAPSGAGAIVAARADQSTEPESVQVAVAPEAKVEAKNAAELAVAAAETAPAKTELKVAEAKIEKAPEAKVTEARPVDKAEPKTVEQAQAKPVEQKVASNDEAPAAETADASKPERETRAKVASEERSGKQSAKSRSKVAERSRPVTRAVRVAAQKATEQRRSPNRYASNSPKDGAWEGGANDMSLLSRYRKI